MIKIDCQEKIKGEKMNEKQIKTREYNKEYYKQHLGKLRQEQKKYRNKPEQKKNRKEYMIEYFKEYAKTPRFKESQKKYHQTPLCKYRDYNRTNAKRRDILFTLTFKEFITFWQIPCYYCNNLIETIGLDRINNDKGYQLDNIVSCCFKCNRMKGKLNKSDFINHCNKISNFRKEE